MNLFRDLGIPAVFLLAVLILIWWKPLKKLKSKGAAAIMPLLIVLASAAQVFAFYDKTDRAEAIHILPDESSFGSLMWETTKPPRLNSIVRNSTPRTSFR